MALVPQVAQAVSIPVIAAGGIADGPGFAAAFMLGAEGVQMGTRFCAPQMPHPSTTPTSRRWFPPRTSTRW
jgi:isopentenyl diphosphate isomerase/L-lactate dehydrogenase-like FMN-dependent dehydrogenase